MRCAVLLALFCLLRPFAGSAAGENVIYDRGGVTASFDGRRLELRSPLLRAAWEWNGSVLSLASLRRASGPDWAAGEALPAWDAAPLGDVHGAEVMVSARDSDDEGFTSPCVEVTAQVAYPASGLSCLYKIWLYPSQAGLRTQLFVKGEPRDGGFDASASNGAQGVALRLPGNVRVTAAGYYNNHDRRNSDNQPVVREECFGYDVSGSRNIDWASLLFMETGEDGALIVKESHKVVNLQGTNTGAFMLDGSTVASTGWGVTGRDLSADAYKPCWAHWVVLYPAGQYGELSGEVALKRFDRVRYPVDPDRDLYIMENVWGSGRQWVTARPQNVIKEIGSCADLGVEVVQIDAGWHKDADPGQPQWEPSRSLYPNGWRPVMDAAEDAGVKMGLWNSGLVVAANPPMLAGEAAQGFRYMKVDLNSWEKYGDLQNILAHVREMETQYRDARVNWDVTAKHIRVGYFLGREYGNLFLQNRRQTKSGQAKPADGVYTPRRILRDGMDMARYMNANQVLLNTIDVTRTDPAVTNAGRYSNRYSFALTMMHMPLFFDETWAYNESEREQLRPLIALYKEHRRAIFDKYVFPVGKSGDDRSWGGYQACNPDNPGEGYLLIFREIDNMEPVKPLYLNFLRGVTIKAEDLVHGTSTRIKVYDNGRAGFVIGEPGDFLFIKYSTQ